MTALEYVNKEGLEIIEEYDENSVLCDGEPDGYWLYNSYENYSDETIIEEFVIERMPKDWREAEDIIVNGVPNQKITEEE